MLGYGVGDGVYRSRLLPVRKWTHVHL